MSLEQKINYQLNKYPAVKRVIKRAYQRGMYAVSKKVESEGNITRVSPNDPHHEYFFGYYDKSPWDITDRYMLCLKANNTWSDVSPREKADILLIDTEKLESDPERVKKIAETRAWNVQQACMLQWLGPDFESKILFNDYRNGKYVSVILNLKTMDEKIIPAPVYTVSSDGTFALTLDFSRLYNLRPGYGYYNVPEKTKDVPLPDTTAVWKVSLETGEISEVLKYTDFSIFQPRPEMQEKGAVHKVNHLMLSPNNERFMVLYRWFIGERKYTRLITCNVDGTDMYVLSDDDMVSHCFWKNDNEIIAFENKKHSGTGYYLMKDKTDKYYHCWKELTGDGHPSFSPDRKLVVTDSYPDRTRMQYIRVMDGDVRKNTVKTVAKVFSPFKYDNDTRCDLHPRWNHAGNKICFDSVFDGHRGLYIVRFDGCLDKNNSMTLQPLVSVIVPVYRVELYLERCVKSILNQSYKNLEIILVDDGSPDNSGQMCDEIALTDSRVKVIHKKNGGLSSARNEGIKNARGDYIAFVDSDDWIDEDIYSICVDIISQYKCDIVDFKTVYTDGKKTRINYRYEKPIKVEKETLLYDYMYRGQTDICPFSVCRKLYKRSLFDQISFPEGRLNEDIVTNYRVLVKSNSLVHISNIGYFYFQNSASITNGPLKKKDFDLIVASEELCKMAKKHEDSRVYELAQIKLARSYFSLLAKAAVGGFALDITNPKKCVKELIKKLRKSYVMLMKAPISVNRKLMITIMVINFNCISFPAKIYKKIRK